MSQPLGDGELALMIGLAEGLQSSYVKSTDPWAASPFGWITHCKSRQVGKIGEQLVAGWCAAKGFDVSKSPNSDADRVIAGHLFEIKFSTLWEAQKYTFQQIRDQNYDFAALLGISPFSAHLWIVEKDVIWANARPQHGGARGTDTRWVTFPPAEPPTWLLGAGGTLAEALSVLNRIQKR